VTERAPHGFSLDEDEHRLLRGRPPAAALEWVCAAVGAGSRVVSVRAQAGGNSSAVHRVIVTDSLGATHRMVLRRYVRRTGSPRNRPWLNVRRRHSMSSRPEPCPRHS
jgi:hypothetical protein